MTHCLVSFLGRAPRESGGKYKTVTYSGLPDGNSHEAAFLGYPLRKALNADRIVIFGTSGSMWDHLFEHDVEIEGNEEARLELWEASENNEASQVQLDRVAPILQENLQCEVQLKIIPHALDAVEQTALVQALAEAAEDADELSLDVTHGFRHLPMLALTAALYLRAIRPQLKIKGLWYGEIQSGTVTNLVGLLETTDWLAALQSHDWLGDYQGIARQIVRNDPEREELADQLRRASFLESIHRGKEARGDIKKVRANLAANPLQGIGGLFSKQLDQRMAWVDEERLYLRQRRHALDALKREDYLRASLYGFEAFVTKETQNRFPSGQENSHDARQQAKDAFESEQYAMRGKANVVWYQYRLVRDLRNVLAHGNQARGEVQKAIDSPQRLRAALRGAFDVLLPDEN